MSPLWAFAPTFRILSLKCRPIRDGRELSFPIVMDGQQVLADRLGATRTPEVVVLDHDRVIRYRGRIDDQYGVGVSKQKATEEYLTTAIEQFCGTSRVR